MNNLEIFDDFLETLKEVHPNSYAGLDQRDKLLLQMAINHSCLVMHSTENLKLKADLYEMTRYAASVCPFPEDKETLEKQADDLRQLLVESDFDFGAWSQDYVRRYEKYENGK